MDNFPPALWKTQFPKLAVSHPALKEVVVVVPKDYYYYYFSL